MKFSLPPSGCKIRPAKVEPDQPVARLATVPVMEPAMRSHATKWAVDKTASKQIDFWHAEGLGDSEGHGTDRRYRAMTVSASSGVVAHGTFGREVQ
jgi:hypothetical protein